MEPYIAVNNFVVLGFLNDTVDALHSVIDIGARSPDKDNVLSRCIADFSTKFD